MRTTPSDEALKELENQALKQVRSWGGDQAGASLAAFRFNNCSGSGPKRKIAEVLDSEFERCRMRLPLTRSFG
uniref:hypothetical protein n=2 Tax=Pseudomonas sp. RW407 TaxID=2202894 RepID=UPI0011B488EB|nr:hypothetical protein [Pseudomonas sp. RW407]